MKAKKGVIPAGYADGGKVKHGDAKQDKKMMTAVADKKVKAHEAAMHGKKMANGGMAKLPMRGQRAATHKAKKMG